MEVCIYLLLVLRLATCFILTPYICISVDIEKNVRSILFTEKNITTEVPKTTETENTNKEKHKKQANKYIGHIQRYNK